MAVFIFFFGLIFGSFANVVVLRMNTGESLIRGGSRCFSCGKKLKWFELIPVFSFIALRGRCRSCKSKISWQYPLVELGTGVLFFLLYLRLQAFAPLSEFEIFNFQSASWRAIFNEFPNPSSLIPYTLLLITAWFSLWVASLYDLRHMILPDRLIAIALGAGAAGVLFMKGFSAQSASMLGAAAAAFLLFFVFWYFSGGRWMGLGDAKFAFVLGILMPPTYLFVSLFLSFLVGGIVGLYFLAVKRAPGGTQIPFGPFLFAGGFLGFLFSPDILEWYIRIVGSGIL